jgi:DNA-binding transcriptional LysR family regulator
MNGYHLSMNDVPTGAVRLDGLDWSLVQVFLALLDAGSLGRAAQGLGLSQPTLSRRLSALEDALGQPLFERRARGLAPTAAALAVREPALAMRAQAQRLALAAEGHSRALAGTVRLTASQSVSSFVLLPVLRGLRQAHPQIQIELVASDAEEDLLARDADIAVRMYRPRQSSLTVRRLADMPLGLFAHRDYLARRGPVDAADLAAHDWIGLDRSPALLDGFAAAGHPVPRSFFGLRCDSSVVGWQAVCQGLGIGVGLAAVAARTPGIVRVLPDIEVPPLQTWLAAHRELRGTPRLRIVWQALADALGRR